MRSVWWGPPRKFDDQPHERKISWLELFYDLVYVAAISQLKEFLVRAQGSGQPLAGVLGPFSLLFLLMLWAWANGSYYHDLHGSEGMRLRFFTLLQMLAAAACAITLAGALGGDHRPFALAFCLLQLVITYLWVEVNLHDRAHLALGRMYLIAYGLALLCLLASLFVSADLAWVLWLLALGINFAPGPLSLRQQERELARRGLAGGPSGTMVERFGCFTMIVLGESVLGILNGTSAIQAKTPLVWACFGLGLTISFELWWIYFDMLGNRSTRRGQLYSQFLNFLHLPLLAAFVSAGAASQILLAQASAGAMIRWLHGGSLSLILACIAALSLIMESGGFSQALTRKIAAILLGVSLLIPLLTWLCLPLAVPVYLGLIALVLLLTILGGTLLWTRHNMFADAEA